MNANCKLPCVTYFLENIHLINTDDRINSSTGDSINQIELLLWKKQNCQLKIAQNNESLENNCKQNLILQIAILAAIFNLKDIYIRTLNCIKDQQTDIKIIGNLLGIFNYLIIMKFYQTEKIESQQREENNKRHSVSASKRKKIFQLSPQINQNKLQSSRRQQDPNISHLGSRIYQIIDNLNKKLEDYESVKAENYFLKQQNANLKLSTKNDFENSNLKREKDQLSNQLFSIKKKITKAKILIQKISQEKKLQRLKQLNDIFEV